MMRADEVSVTTTIAYADVFDYPLTVTELTRWCVGKRMTPAAVRRVLSRWVSGRMPVAAGTDMVYFRDRPSLPALRRRRLSASRRKWEIARRAASYFRLVPTVLLVGVTGGLAMDNADAHDDIDLFFVVHDRTLWASRLAVTLVAEVFLKRRRPGDRELEDRVCLNMFLTSSAMTQPAEDRDLFGAHEVLQMRPVWQRREVHRAFLVANAWVRRFLPNAWDDALTSAAVPGHRRTEARSRTAVDSVISIVFQAAEPVFRVFQQLYMLPRRTTETVTDDRIKFHPHDARVWVKRKLRTRLVRYNIPLDKVFHGRIK